MPPAPITSVFNDAYVTELYERFLRDPASVDDPWRQYFAMAQRLVGAPAEGGAVAAPPTDTAYLRKVAGAAMLVRAVRQYGHLAVPVDPLGTPPTGAAELTPEFYGITEQDLGLIPGAALGFANHRTAASAIAFLRALYASRIGYEFHHLEDEHERAWFRERIEGGAMQRSLAPEEKIALLRRLTEVDGFERFLGRAYQGYKRFSIEGTDALVPMLDAVVEGAAKAGAREVVIGMAHRGRISVLTHVLEKPAAAVFAEFEGKHGANAASDTGDVKYHLGAHAVRTFEGGARVAVAVVPNPSHLEFVNPVLEGTARALQRTPTGQDEAAVIPVLVHGDAAFPGEGVVAETFNLSNLRGYRTGGTLHIIVNNQVGFTTDPRDGRSTYYASDLAKGFEVPVVHVNGDDAEGCLAAIRLGLEYRERFKKDFLVDLVGYRRWGHNEADEPAYTQPQMYAVIKAHPTPREAWGAHLVNEGVIDADAVAALDREVQERYERLHEAAKRSAEPADAEQEPSKPAAPIDTTVKSEQLIALNERMLTWPSDFSPVPKLAKQLERRRVALGGGAEIDWGHAEALAFASLLAEGVNVRLTGQDVERGTFSHRQAVLHDVQDGRTYAPLQHITGAPGRFEIFNSPLSEVAVLGFEYGYSVAAPDAVVIWEAQFGDFANVAQPVIDQFIASDRAKWGQDSGIVLNLPHGYEGQGPEHSSARLERFLQLCAEHNMHVAYPSTPAQYFHILRRQARLAPRRPLVLMQPKSLLRLPAAASKLADLTGGSFRPVIDDASAAAARAEVKRLVLCAGKIYYDLAAAERAPGVAIVRIEELYPWPHEALAAVLDGYPNVEEVVWAQEEPKNMGAWSFVSPRLRGAVGNATPIRYVGRPDRASPAEGYQSAHMAAQAAIVAEAVTLGARRSALGVR
ncbi:MAG TPA: 2-oxoglutarate dehydrogenase E1 component [Gemmatimonadaceae bacterium]|nr:2-oxoglutarate dehydrogenase E1 component [Gemmatimonadaceae bacterium]